MNCRKCGAKHITRRAAGLFSCRHCGIQPGPNHLCRAGLPTRPPVEISQVFDPTYTIAPRAPRLPAATN